MRSSPARAQNAGAELHRREMSLADRAQAEDEPAAPGRQARLVGVRDGGGVEQGGRLDRELVGEPGAHEAASLVRQIGGVGYPVRDLLRSAPSARPAGRGGAPRSGHRPASRSLRPRRRAARGSATAPLRPGTDLVARARDRARTAAPAPAPDRAVSVTSVGVTHSVTRRRPSSLDAGLLQRREQRQSGLRALVLVAPEAFQTVEAATGHRVVHRRAGVVVAEEPRRGELDPVGPPPSSVDRRTPARRRRPAPPPRSAAGRTPVRRRPDRSRRPGRPTDARPGSAGRAASPAGRGRPRRARANPAPRPPRAAPRAAPRWRSSAGAPATATRCRAQACRSRRRPPSISARAATWSGTAASTSAAPSAANAIARGCGERRRAPRSNPASARSRRCGTRATAVPRPQSARPQQSSTDAVSDQLRSRPPPVVEPAVGLLRRQHERQVLLAEVVQLAERRARGRRPPAPARRRRRSSRVPDAGWCPPRARTTRRRR